MNNDTGNDCFYRKGFPSKFITDSDIEMLFAEISPMIVTGDYYLSLIHISYLIYNLCVVLPEIREWLKMFEIPEYVQKVLNRLEQNGFEACIVGGCVRDFLLEKTPHDYDVTTNALPEQIKECFSDISNIDYGQKHGTVARCV